MIALGRKNWKFVGSCIIGCACGDSLTRWWAVAAIWGIDPFAYLREVLPKMHELWEPSRPTNNSPNCSPMPGHDTGRLLSARRLPWPEPSRQRISPLPAPTAFAGYVPCCRSCTNWEASRRKSNSPNFSPMPGHDTVRLLSRRLLSSPEPSRLHRPCSTQPRPQWRSPGVYGASMPTFFRTRSFRQRSGGRRSRWLATPGPGERTLGGHAATGEL